jgi:hypothetical protein
VVFRWHRTVQRDELFAEHRKLLGRRGEYNGVQSELVGLGRRRIEWRR